jgi:hypothetical protein
VPILNKEITLPFFEKKPEVVLKLAQEKLSQAKSMEFNANVNVKANMDYSKMMSQNSAIKTVASLNNTNPRVLGESESLELNATTTSDLQLPMGFTNPSDSEPVSVNMNYKLDTKIDQTNPADLKSQTNFEFNIKPEEKNGKIPMEIGVGLNLISIGSSTYFNVVRVPEMLTMFVGDKFINKWYEINLDEAKKFQDDIKNQYQDKVTMNINPSVTFVQSLEKKESLNKEIEQVVQSYSLLEVQERLPDEIINGKKSYHYKVQVNKDSLEKIVVGVTGILVREAKNSTSTEAVEIQKMEQQIKPEEIAAQIKNVLTDLNGEVWVDKKEFYPQKITFNGKIDLSKINIDGKQMIKEGGYDVTVSGEVNFTSFNMPLNIQTGKFAIFNSGYQGMGRRIFRYIGGCTSKI